jgi:hypothetical protein
MVTRLNTEPTPYVNIIELVYMFLIVELHYGLSHFMVYDMDKHAWNIRRIVWYTILGVPTILAVGVFLLAALKYLLN